MPHDERLQIIIQELVRRTSDETRRLRELEQRLEVLETRMNSIEETNLEKLRKINSRFDESQVVIKTINNDLLNLKNNLNKINTQISKFARKKDVQEILNMFELLNPIRQEFITRDELEKMQTRKHTY